jgi:hypothetical protein
MTRGGLESARYGRRPYPPANLPWYRFLFGAFRVRTPLAVLGFIF